MAIFDFFQWTRVLSKWNDVLPITSGSTDLFFAAGEALGGDVAGQRLSLGAGALILRVRHRLVQMSKPRQKSKQKRRSSGSSLAGQTRIDVWNYRTVNVRYAGRSTGVHRDLRGFRSVTFRRLRGGGESIVCVSCTFCTKAKVHRRYLSFFRQLFKLEPK